MVRVRGDNFHEGQGALLTKGRVGIIWNNGWNRSFVFSVVCFILTHSHSSDARQNKGSILKASVDHIRRLHREMDKIKTFEHKQRQLEDTNRVLQMRIRVSERFQIKPIIFNITTQTCTY